MTDAAGERGEERLRRIGRNEDLFRKVNDEVESVNEAFGVVTGDFAVVCECGNLSCIEQIRLSKELYERVRSDSTLFVIVPSHKREDAEDIVEGDEDYAIVRKREGVPAEVARQLDDRS
ncbi:MAG: hypothetical protein QOE36_3369 [Gaiellaceae bacterium]|jgi:hypothetical protein|nr:hypothetical protein [Gaiellaceae bacterium]